MGKNNITLKKIYIYIMFKSQIILLILLSIVAFYIISKATKNGTTIDGKRNETCTNDKSKCLVESVRGWCYEACQYLFFLVPKIWKGWKGKELITANGKTCADLGYPNYNTTLIKRNFFVKIYLDRYDKPE